MTQATYEVIHKTHVAENWEENGQARRRVYDFKGQLIYRDEIETSQDRSNPDPRKRFSAEPTPDRVNAAYKKHLELGGDAVANMPMPHKSKTARPPSP